MEIILIVHVLITFYPFYLIGRYKRIEEMRAKWTRTLTNLLEAERYPKASSLAKFLDETSADVMLLDRFGFGDLQKFEKKYRLILEV